VLTSGEVQLLKGVPVKEAAGGAVTVMALVKVVSEVHPQLLVSKIEGEYTPFCVYILQTAGFVVNGFCPQSIR
jgi:hypothetical protein